MSKTLTSDYQMELLRMHVKHFEKVFASKERLPRDKDWRPFRFAVRDEILGLLVLRYESKNNVIEVDVCLSDDPFEISGYSGTKIVSIFILSEAYKSGSSMGIRFTSNFGKKSVPVPGNIFDLAYDYGVDLKKAGDGVLTPKEARHFYLALTEFSPEAEKHIMELSLADKVTPERICYMVHHLTYTKEDMEAVLLGTEYPEHILLGEVTPEEYMLYQDVVLRTRDVVLGGILDRTLKLKEVVNKEGKVMDLEGNERQFDILFDTRFFAKVYDVEENTTFPWTTEKKVKVSAGERALVMIRARDWADFQLYFERDIEALKAMKKAYKDDSAHFFLLVPRNVLELDTKVLEKYRKRLAKLKITLLVCPESVSLLDKEVMRRLKESETMRHSIGSGEEHHEILPVKSDFDFNTSEITLVAVPANLTIGRISLMSLLEQAIYDENELFRRVNKHSVRARYHLVCDRMQFLAHQAVQEGKRHLVLTSQTLKFFSRTWADSPEHARKNRLMPTFWVPEQAAKFIEAVSSLVGKGHPFEKGIGFLNTAVKKKQVVIAVQDKHAPQSEKEQEAMMPAQNLTGSFTGQFVPDWISDHSDLEFEEVVVKQLWRATNSARRGQANAVNLSEVPHVPITKALHKMVYEYPKKVDNQEVAVNIVYTDGSQALPFPLFCLKGRVSTELAKLREETPLSVGLISMRHPEMDQRMEHYWFRNIEVSQPGMTSAEVDELSYNITLRKLREMTENGNLARFNFYQTGFQAPLIGFWRAVVEFLRERQSKTPVLEIIPQFYTKIVEGKGYKYIAGGCWH